MTPRFVAVVLLAVVGMMEIMTGVVGLALLSPGRHGGLLLWWLGRGAAYLVASWRLHLDDRRWGWGLALLLWLIVIYTPQPWLYRYLQDHNLRWLFACVSLLAMGAEALWRWGVPWVRARMGG